jgi:hypothetical protein
MKKITALMMILLFAAIPAMNPAQDSSFAKPATSIIADSGDDDPTLDPIQPPLPPDLVPGNGSGKG